MICYWYFPEKYFRTPAFKYSTRLYSLNDERDHLPMIYVEASSERFLMNKILDKSIL
jgi:hypothetical protein